MVKDVTVPLYHIQFKGANVETATPPNIADANYLKCRAYSITEDRPAELVHFIEKINAAYARDYEIFTWELTMYMSLQLLRVFKSFGLDGADDEVFDIIISEVDANTGTIYMTGEKDVGTIIITNAVITSFPLEFTNESLAEVTISGLSLGVTTSASTQAP